MLVTLLAVAVVAVSAPVHANERLPRGESLCVGQNLDSRFVVPNAVRRGSFDPSFALQPHWPEATNRRPAKSPSCIEYVGKARPRR